MTDEAPRVRAPFESSDDPRRVLKAYYAALDAGLRVEQDSQVDTGKYRYNHATLKQTLTAIESVLTRHGVHVSVVPSGTMDGLVATLIPLLLDEEGEWMKFPPYVRPQLRDEQGFGSLISYGRRYALTSIFGLLPADDDDGAAATSQQRNEVQYGGKRTAEESAIVTILGAYPEDFQRAFGERFRTQFGRKLSDLNVVDHADALHWTVRELPTIEVPAPEVPPE
jgi:hypothetical protein